MPITTVRLALWVDGCLLTVSNTSHLKCYIDGSLKNKKEQGRMKINIPGGNLNNDDLNDEHCVNGIAREIREELGLIIPLDILRHCDRIRVEDQLIFVHTCTLDDVLLWVSELSTTPWEISGVVMYSMTENNRIMYATINNDLTVVINKRLIELNRYNQNANNKYVKVNRHYGYWKHNNIIVGSDPTDFNITRTTNKAHLQSQLEGETMLVNWELYRYIITFLPILNTYFT